MSMQLVFTQILIILLYVAVGFVAGRTRLILPEQRKYLTALCSNLILPFTVFAASSQTAGGREMAGVLISLVFSLAVFLGVTAASMAFHRFRGAPRGIAAVTSSLLTYPNCTFLGLPLCRALFGEMAVLYNAGMLVAFNALFFTLQYSLFTGSVNLKNLITPAMVSTVGLIVMLALGLHFPDPVQAVCSGIGSMITPLTLIIIGVMLSESNIAAVFRGGRAYIVTLLRNLVIPLLCMLVLRLLPLDAEARLCMLVYLACPCATLTSIYAIKCDTEPVFAANAVLLSTILFAATLPLIIAIGQAFL